MATSEVNKDSSFSLIEDPLTKKTTFRCDVCERIMASKQNVLKHLFSAHGFSPLKKKKKKYMEDPSLPVPVRTSSRWKMQARVLSGNDNIQSTSYQSLPHEYSNSIGNSPIGNFEDSSPYLAEQESLPYCEEYEPDIDDSSITSESDSTTRESTSDWSDSSISDDEDDKNQEIENGNEIASLSVLSCMLRNNLSVSTSKDIIQTMKTAFPDSEGLRSLIYEDMWKHVGANNFKEFHYCALCENIFPNDLETFNCSTPSCSGLRYKGGLQSQRKAGRQAVASFMLADTRQQLESLIESPGIWANILRNKKKLKELATEGNMIIQDVWNGLEYQELMSEGQFLFGEDNTNVTAILNTDGINLYSSSKVELWPIFLAINELSPEARFARENMILAGIWQGKGKPPFFQYLKAFCNDMNDLYENGVYSTKLEVNVRLAVICATVDLPAKAGVMNMTLFNGSEACVTCEEPGKVVKQGKGHSRCYPFRSPDEKYSMRSSADIQLCMQSGSVSHRMKGFKGNSGLVYLSSMSLPAAIVPDYMHGVLLGITKTLMYKWFSSTESKQEYFVGNHLKEISKRLSSINPPDFIERLPRNLEKSYTHFKATEFQSWLLFYGLPCLSGILPPKYLDHFALLSEAIYILLGDHILPSDMTRAEHMLNMFYEQFANLYSAGSCGLNVHNVGAHLVYFVKHWGPLWAWSCFAFEDSNAMILQAVHGTGNVMRQVLRLKEAQGLLRRSEKPTTGSKKWKKLKNASNCEIAGALKPLQDDCFSDLIKAKLSINNLAIVQQASRIVTPSGQKFFSQKYDRMKRRACNFVLLTDGRVASINYFVLSSKSQSVYAAIKLFDQVEDSNIQDLAAGKHLIPVRNTNVCDIVPVECLSDSLFYINTNGSNSSEHIFISRAPNSHGRSIFK